MEIRPSRSVTEQLQISVKEAALDEDFESDLHFEARGRTPEHKSKF